MIVDYNDSCMYQHCDDFTLGLNFLKSHSLPQALINFRSAYNAVSYNDIYHNKYASFCGLARVLNGDRSGVELCRDAARQEMRDGDVFLNLAYAEWFMDSRKRSIGVIEKGLAIDGQHLGLNKLQSHLGKRAKPVLFFVARDSFLNKTLGKIVRKKMPFKDDWTYQHLL